MGEHESCFNAPHIITIIFFITYYKIKVHLFVKLNAVSCFDYLSHKKVLRTLLCMGKHVTLFPSLFAVFYLPSTKRAK